VRFPCSFDGFAYGDDFRLFCLVYAGRVNVVAPVFFYDSNTHWIDLKRAVATTERASRLFLSRQPQIVAYDAKLNRWSVAFDAPAGIASAWSRLLANTVYNPVREVPLQWNHSGSYEIDELRTVILEAVAHDDDILTQFVERGDLSSRLEQATSFAEFVATWDWLSAPH
jgi:hypothetical protein